MKRTNKIRMTEGQMRNLIKESIKMILENWDFESAYDCIRDTFVSYLECEYESLDGYKTAVIEAINQFSEYLSKEDVLRAASEAYEYSKKDLADRMENLSDIVENSTPKPQK